MDKYIINYLNSLTFPEIINNFMIFISSMVNFGLFWIIIAVFLLISKKYRNIGLMLTLGLLTDLLIVDCFLKILIHRTRPFDEINNIILLINPPKDYSFPSGHTSVSFMAATILCSKIENYYFKICIFVFAALVAFSRIFLKVHFLSDIIGGIFIGCLCGLISIYFFNKLKRNKTPVI